MALDTTKRSFVCQERRGVLDIHNYPARLKHEIDYLHKSTLSEANKKAIRRFHDDCVVSGLSKPRIIKLLESMRVLAGKLRVDLEKADIDDLKDLVTQIENAEWTPWTKATYRSILKKFYKWLRGKDDEYPPEVKFIRTTIKRKDRHILSEKDLITPEEVQKAIDHAYNPRDKAFISILAESGCRIGEIGSLAMRNVAIDGHGAILTVVGKTGARRVRIVQSVKQLKDWLNCHPYNDNPNSALWINIGTVNFREPTQYPALAKIIRDAFRHAGIHKRCNPHLFRHSRASVLANHLTEFQMNHYFGWTQGSNMPSTYVHLSGKELVLTTASTPRAQNTEIDVTGLDGSTITLIIRGLYRRGYDTIIVTTKDSHATHLRTRQQHTVEDCITSEINRLIGFEIFNSSRTRFELKSVSAEHIEDFDTVLRRIFLLTLQYYGDFRKALADKDANAMAALDEKPVALTKFISYASRLLNKNGHAKFDYSPFLYHIVEMLELISDSIKVTARFCAGHKMSVGRRTLVAVGQVEEALRMYYESYYKFSHAAYAEFIALHDRVVRAIDAGYDEPSKADIAVLLNLRQIPDVIRESLRIRASIL